MHITKLDNWKHGHFYSNLKKGGVTKTKIVIILTFTTMIAEIAAGIAFGSMALLADGWHMATHVAAFLITLFAYKYAAKNDKNPEFTFGTGKVTSLGGFSSAIALLAVAIVMAVESVQRFFNPIKIDFKWAIIVAVIGLLINVVCAFILKDNHNHSHNHKHSHDHNLKAAYFHVLADALTSIFAIIALLMGLYFSINWLDPIIGITGSLIISKWAYSLIKETSPILLDRNTNKELSQSIFKIIEQNSDNRISDLHIWQLNSKDYAAIVSIVTHYPKPITHYKNLLKPLYGLSHISIEVNACNDEPCIIEK